jgi:hypothetical protein
MSALSTDPPPPSPKEVDALFRDLGEAGMPEFERPRAFTSDQAEVLRQALPPSPAAIITSLFEDVTVNVIMPAIQADTREAYRRVLREGLGSYFDALKVTSVLVRRYGLTAQVAERDFHADLLQVVHNVAGDDGVLEVEFAVSTHDRAERLARRIRGREHVNAAAEHELGRSYWNQSGLHLFGVLALYATKIDGASDAGLRSSFELMRGGALRAYVAVREAFELHQPPQPAPEGFVPFDDEDARLARA